MNKHIIDRLLEQSEKEKDEKFQKIFKELWPNTYSMINEPLSNSTAKKNSILDLNSENPCFVKCKKCGHYSWYSCVKCVEEPVHKEPELKLQDYFSKYLSNTSPTLNTFTTQNSDRLNAILKRENDYLNALKSRTADKYPNAVSAYDTPFLAGKYSERLVGSLYNDDSLTNEIKLLQEIKDNNEKLRTQNKIEKTNDLVDDIIKKVEVIHNEIKKKQAEIRVKENLEVLKEKVRRERSKSPSLLELRNRSSSRERNHNHHHHHYCDIHVPRPKTGILKRSNSPSTRSHSRVSFLY